MTGGARPGQGPRTKLPAAGWPSAALGSENVHQVGRASGSEDVGILARATEVPLAHWWSGGIQAAFMADMAPGQASSVRWTDNERATRERWPSSTLRVETPCTYVAPDIIM